MSFEGRERGREEKREGGKCAGASARETAIVDYGAGLTLAGLESRRADFECQGVRRGHHAIVSEG